MSSTLRCQVNNSGINCLFQSRAINSLWTSNRCYNFMELINYSLSLFLFFFKKRHFLWGWLCGSGSFKPSFKPALIPLFLCGNTDRFIFFSPLLLDCLFCVLSCLVNDLISYRTSRCIMLGWGMQQTVLSDCSRNARLIFSG